MGAAWLTCGSVLVTMMPPSKFRIYYGDGSVYEGPVADAPPVDVQCIVIPDHRGTANEVGRQVMFTFEYYIYAEGQWMGISNLIDLIDHLLYRKVEKVLKGRMIQNDRYEAIIKRAHKDPGFPRKSAKHPAREDGEWALR